MEDKDIVKALECCLRDDESYGADGCEHCPLNCANDCTNLIRKYSFDLINRLQAELTEERNKNSKLRNERNHLQADLDSLIQNDLPRCKDALRRANEMGMELQAENERLKNSLAISKKETKRFQGSYKTAKAEAYKEFVERLKKEQYLSIVDMVVSVTAINNLLKELVGDADDKH